MALGFPALPCYARIFNDNMVAQAVAAPLRGRGGEGGGGGKARQGLISEEAKDVYEALPLAALTPIRHSVEIRHHFDSAGEYADYLSSGFSPLLLLHFLGNYHISFVVFVEN